ncbi:MAG: arginine--tRNA ligase [Candidatus Paceibacterota bacterium]|jgi:arginyl-tRNA synthetase
MKEILEEELKTILRNIGIQNPTITFDVPIHVELGDYSTNVAMAYAKQLGTKPVDLAEEIKKKLTEKSIENIFKINVIAPGFLNFFFNENYFGGVVKEIILKKNKYGESDSLLGQKIMVEFTDPNPFKEFHIGHLMSNSIGESISRILESQGAKVFRANWQGDVGVHIAKAVWGMFHSPLSNDDKSSIEKSVIYLGRCYALGASQYEEDEKVKKEIQEINNKIYEKSDLEINEKYEWGRKVSLDYFEIIYKKLGTKFDYYFFESKEGVLGKKIVEEYLEKGIFEKSDGAVVFKGEKYGLHTRVFINSNDIPTYEAKELGLNREKFIVEPKLDQSVIITGNEINEYFKVLLQVISLIFPEVGQKTKHISHGMLRLPEGKMSSRTGNVITAESLILEVQQKTLEKMKDRRMSEKTQQEISETIAIGALKYSILKQTTGKDIIFDFDKSVSFEGDSGPYLQYATVRANSILKKSASSADQPMRLGEIPENWKTTNLERILERFPSVMERAGTEYAPSHIATYLIELSGEFNSFYASHKIINETDPTSSYRLALTQAFVYIMTSGLNLLAIKIPEQM